MEDGASNGIHWLKACRVNKNTPNIPDKLNAQYHTVHYMIRRFIQAAKFDTEHYGSGSTIQLAEPVKTVYDAFMKLVGGSLNIAFPSKDGKIKNMEALVFVAKLCGFVGPAQSVFPLLTKVVELFQSNYLGARDLQDCRLVNVDGKTCARLRNAILTLTTSMEKTWGKFDKTMMPLPTGTPFPIPKTAARATGPSQSVPSYYDYLNTRIKRRQECTKCWASSDPEQHELRLHFANPSEDGRGRTKDVSRKRGCPYASHAINSSGHGVQALEDYEQQYGVILTSKKKKFEEYMRDEKAGKGVERLGKPPHYKVSMYNPILPWKTKLAVDADGKVKLNLTPSGYEKNFPETKNNYGGFMIV